MDAIESSLPEFWEATGFKIEISGTEWHIKSQSHLLSDLRRDDGKVPRSNLKGKASQTRTTFEALLTTY
jgi:hypothetical protein